MRTDTCIEFDDVVAGYKEFMILNNLSFKARRGTITLLLGPNGAGKSTVLKTLFGLLRPRQGRILLDGAPIGGASQKELLARGVAFVPQGRNLFGQLTVWQNLELGGAFWCWLLVVAGAVDRPLPQRQAIPRPPM